MRYNKKPVRRSSRRAGLRDLAFIRAERYKEGLQQGYSQGKQAGFSSYDELFDGTSIILPIQNDRNAALSCIEAIMDMTNLPFEIIVVDNGSQDGIEHDLKKLEGLVRYRRLEENTGIAGAVNRGLMMAKGTTILIMSCQLLPTEKWLENMLACLEQDESAGLVGPVSCGLPGVQKLELEYRDIEEMHDTARLQGERRQGLKQRVTALSMGCMLMRSEVMRRVGYLDESCESLELLALDYSLRCMLQGYSLFCAQDAYMHVNEESKAHAVVAPASLTLQSNLPMMEYIITAISQASSIAASEASNHAQAGHSLEMKWKEASTSFLTRFSKTAQSHTDSGQRGERRFYPEKVAVQGLNGTVYWIEDGFRRPIEGEWHKPVIRLSQLDLWCWPIGKPMRSDEAILPGKLYQTEDGSVYYLESGSKRPFINAYAQSAWGLKEQEFVRLTSDEFDLMRTGEPIIAPVQLRQSL